ncbi:MAG: beta-Ala-His dipeptidase [Oscillospiraceae bacterium]|jgi:dipeptidase D
MRKAEKVFSYFEELSKIPRSSGDERAVADWLVRFAEERHLEYVRDERNNVIIRKPATKAGCQCPPVILQGHTDMVYIRTPDCKHKYEDGIRILEKDGFLSADGTTLGADDGIAVAYALAVLDSNDIEHPELECVFTVSEETGLMGAASLDYSQLRGKRMLNMDSEKEGIFCTGCAGAFRVDYDMPLRYEVITGTKMTVAFKDLMGGHSGEEINRGRANAITLMGRLLDRLGRNVHIVSLAAEGKTNAISNNATAELCVFTGKEDLVEKTIRAAAAEFQAECGERDTIHVEITRGTLSTCSCYDEETQARVASSLLLFPSGVIAMSYDVPDLVQTSSNPATLEQTDGMLKLAACIRSSVGTRKTEMRARVAALAAALGAKCVCGSDYPQWEYKPVSPLRDTAMQTYEELFGKKAEAHAIHAGLECGYFDVNIPDIDIISFGPNMEDIHTPKERIEIASIERMWDFLLALLKKLTEE